MLVQNLEGLGFTVVPFGQGFKYMSPPTKELMNLVLSKRNKDEGVHAGNKKADTYLPEWSDEI